MTSKTRKNQGRVHHKKKLTENIKSSAKQGILPATVKGTLAALMSCLILSFISSAFLYRCADPDRYVIPTALCASYFSCFVGGLIGSKANRGGALLCGIAVSTLFYLLLFVISLLLPHSFSREYSLPLAIGVRGIGGGVSILGALMGACEKSPKRKRNR